MAQTGLSLRAIFTEPVERSDSFVIHFATLKLGEREYALQAGDAFLAEYGTGLLNRVEASVDVKMEKRTEVFLVFHIVISGIIGLECDRCLENFDFPVFLQQNLIVNLRSQPVSSDDDDLIILPMEAAEIDLGPTVHDLLVLAIPMRKVCEMVGQECNPEMVKRLEQESPMQHGVDERWAALKNLKDPESGSLN